MKYTYEIFDKTHMALPGKRTQNSCISTFDLSRPISTGHLAWTKHKLFHPERLTTHVLPLQDYGIYMYLSALAADHLTKCTGSQSIAT